MLATATDTEMLARELPAEFVLGTSCSALQVEGALTADGRGPSIWDEFAPGGAEQLERAGDHYRRWPEDLELLGLLSADAHRLSIAWPRIVPDGRGRPKRAALDHYARVIAGLRERGIAPIVCLYHWDLPQPLQDAGGWGSRETADRFGEYASMAAAALGDGVEAWVTVNEPIMHLLRGHIFGDHAPGLMLKDWAGAAHGLLRGHGAAVAALRAAGVRGAVGLIENYSPVRGVSPDGADQFAAAAFDVLRNRLLLDAVLTGAYPEAFLARMPPLAAAIADGDMEAISAPLDFLGINYYGPSGVQAVAADVIPPFRPGVLTTLPRSAIGMPIDPDGLRETLTTLAERYRDTLPPLLVTELGRDLDDPDTEPGSAPDDSERIAYLAAHLRAIAAAATAGVDVRGCLVWSLLDGFEWEFGLDVRYGLVHVDHTTQRRTPRRSFGWLAQLAAARPAPPPRPLALAETLRTPVPTSP